MGGPDTARVAFVGSRALSSEGDHGWSQAEEWGPGTCFKGNTGCCDESGLQEARVRAGGFQAGVVTMEAVRSGPLLDVL